VSLVSTMASHDRDAHPHASPVFEKALLVVWVSQIVVLLLLITIVGKQSIRRGEDASRMRLSQAASQRADHIRDVVATAMTSGHHRSLQELVASADWLTPLLDRERDASPVIGSIAIRAPDGTTLLRSGTEQEPSPTGGHDIAATNPSASTVGNTPYVESTETEYVADVMHGQSRVGSVDVVLSQQRLNEAIRQSRTPAFWAFLILALVSLAILVLVGVAKWRLIHRLRAADLAAAREVHLTELGRVAHRMVHEIRNPLNAIRMQAAVARQRLASGDGDHKRAVNEQLELLEQEVLRLEEMARSFLVLGRPPEAQPHCIALDSLLGEVVDLVRPEFEEKRALLTVKPANDEDQSVAVWADHDYLRRVVLNLVENARDAIGTGGECHIRYGRTSETKAFIDVRDTGPGIQPHVLPRIFEVSYSTKRSGCGLGLAIAQQLTASFGGSIHVESQVGQGTCFHVEVPLAAESLETAEEDPGEPVSA
jgi:signal transduction histidine kinase